jgi:hypothetical protein
MGRLSICGEARQDGGDIPPRVQYGFKPQVPGRLIIDSKPPSGFTQWGYDGRWRAPETLVNGSPGRRLDQGRRGYMMHGNAACSQTTIREIKAWGEARGGCSCIGRSIAVSLTQLQ